MKDKHDWNYSFDKDFKFEGGLVPKLTAFFVERRKECGDAYGKKQAVSIIHPSPALADNVNDPMNVGGLDLSCFDEEDVLQLMYKTMVGCGIYFGFRGNSEHTTFIRKNLERGIFEEGHPLQGEEFYAVRTTN